uniref:Uncharacterized protein n=1 Tax=Caenorhabditis japonica TaxID=281687 RepID=A0A8R1EF66_CAEJA
MFTDATGRRRLKLEDDVNIVRIVKIRSTEDDASTYFIDDVKKKKRKRKEKEKSSKVDDRDRDACAFFQLPFPLSKSRRRCRLF